MRHEVVEETQMEVMREGMQVRQVFEAIALVSEGSCQLQEKYNPLSTVFLQHFSI